MGIENLSKDMQEYLGTLGASEVESYNTEGKCNYAKRIIICTAKDNILARKIAHLFKEKFKENSQCFHTDGMIKGDWIILDFHDVIVHIFTSEARKKFNIDKMWERTQI